jgi:hypothetical protein
VSPQDEKATSRDAAKSRVVRWKVQALAVIALIVALGLLLAGRIATQVVQGASRRPVAPAPELALGRVDVHAESNGRSPFDLAVSLTRMSNDCATPLDGQYCLRYTILEDDDRPIQTGYGLISATAVQVNGSTITLAVNTSTYPGFHRTTGKGGLIALTWTISSPSPAAMIGHETTQLYKATVQGSIVGYVIPSASATASALFYAKT